MLSIGLKQTDNLSPMFVFCQAALRALDSPHITSRPVLICRIFLEDIAMQRNLCICSYAMVPGCRDIPANCKADELAREGTTTELQSLHDYGIPIATLKLKFEEESIKEANLSWLNTSVYKQLKLIWPSTNKTRTLDLLSLKRNNIHWCPKWTLAFREAWK